MVGPLIGPRSQSITQGMSFDAIRHIPCLILLGELGIGKTRELKQQEAYTRSQLAEATFAFDLSGYQNETELRQDLVQDPRFQRWLTGTHQLHLFLDSFDEALLTIPVLSKLLSRIFTSYQEHLQRLFLRIACRTAEWPKTLEENLQLLWGQEQVAVYQLASLRSDDIREAAKVNDISPDRFLEEIDRKAVMPLATRPITLEFLINLYRTDKTFPSTKAELYLEGCRRLCSETEERQDVGAIGMFSPQQRLLIASHLAFLSLFANRSTFWMDVDKGNVPTSDLTLYDCWGETETPDTPVSEKALRETLATGLFSSRGQKRLGWAHRSYAEFLAAHYLMHHQVPTIQIMNILVHPGDTQHKLIPQLHETAAWCAATRNDLFREILGAEPELLLRCDLAIVSEKNRADLVTALLCMPNPGALLYIHRNSQGTYKPLKHQGLAEQLRPYISDQSMEMVRRLVSISIAEACELEALQEDLVQITLDSTQSRLVRQQAARAIVRVGNEETKRKLKPLALEDHGDDPDDELKAYALQALWPGLLTTAEVFDALTLPKDADLANTYFRFLVSYLPEHVEPGDLPAALRWVAQLPRQDLVRSSPLTSTADKLLVRAFDHLDRPEVLEALVDAFIIRLRSFAQLIGSSFLPEAYALPFSGDQIRYHLLETLIHRLSRDSHNPTLLLAAQPPLLFSHDVLWLITSFSQISVETVKRFVAQLIARLANTDDPAQLDAIKQACKTNPYLAQEISSQGERRSVDLSTAQSEKATQDHPQEQGKELSQTEHIQRITTLLSTYEQGDSIAWSHATYQLRWAPDGTSLGPTFELDITLLPSWSLVESTLGERFVEGAKRYIQEEGPDPSVWSNLDKIHYPITVLAYVQAFHLILRQTPDFLLSLSQTAWYKLCLSLLICATLEVDRSIRTRNEEITRQLIAMAYQYAPEQVIASVIQALEKEYWECEYSYPRILQQIEHCRDERLEQALLTKAQDQKGTPQCMGCLLRDLLAHDMEQARVFAVSLLALPLPSDEHGQAKALSAAFALITCTEDAGWSVIWPTMLRERAFALQLVTKITQSGQWHVQQLTEDRIADFYIWLVREHPPSQYPTHLEGFVGSTDSIAFWRDDLLNYLKGRGTFQACDAIERIIQEVPELDAVSMGWILTETQLLARQRDWNPLTPRELLKIIQDQRVRLVQNGNQLLMAVIESLKRLEFKLHDDNPAARDLWDRVPVCTDPNKAQTRGRKKKKREFTYRPIDENEFSDYVKRHLETDLSERGIVANREVVISPENRIDIRVEAITPQRNNNIHDIVSVIIEVKGCWNRKLMDSMEEQLVNRYLKNNRCQHGLYLIAWFKCDAWGDDKRKYDVPKMTLDQAREYFEKQATELSQRPISVQAFVMNTTLSEDSVPSPQVEL